MNCSNMSLVNELNLLNNINIEKVKKSNEFSQQTNQENDYDSDLLNKYNLNLYSRNLLKNTFFTKYLLTPSDNNIGDIEKKIIFKKEKSKESPIFLDSYNNIGKKNIKKKNLSLTVLNYNNNQIKKIPTKKFSHDEYRKKKIRKTLSFI